MGFAKDFVEVPCEDNIMSGGGDFCKKCFKVAGKALFWIYVCFFVAGEAISVVVEEVLGLLLVIESVVAGHFSLRDVVCCEYKEFFSIVS